MKQLKNQTCNYCRRPVSGRNICPRCSEKRKLIRKIVHATWEGKPCKKIEKEVSK